ncbi:MAG: hypothetical protein ACRDJS_08045 [Actinomycetota bacterium]|jgi:hypothetical protein
MRSAIAWVVYMLGLVLGLKVLVTGLVSDGLWGAFGGVAFAVALWWIAAGIGVRLGETPENFMASIAAVLGFGDRPQAPSVPADKKGRSGTE